jgi:hypothetical protein
MYDSPDLINNYPFRHEISHETFSNPPLRPNNTKRVLTSFIFGIIFGGLLSTIIIDRK